ncbi:biosynthetic-type acetolactate synthase large subunit [Lentisphaerota bacterium WC36G]|nr:biosynthetic-type acetolactate synthase large subunit [Lentisphaerae bacterium WC36]
MKNSSKKLKGCQVTVKCLEKMNVDIMFAYPGGCSLELHQALQDSDIRVVLPRHEQGGAFAAAGYARATGKVGVCMATSGPGATNLITGIADAYMDSIPCVFITGQVPLSLIGRNAFQETDFVGMTRPIVKHNYLVLDAKDLPRIIKEAFHIASTGRPGPVLIDIPKNVQQQLIDENIEYDCEMDIPMYEYHYHVKKEEIDSIKEAIKNSKKPCVYAGGGIISAEANDELLEFAEKYNIPVVTTLMGVGGFPETHPLSLKWLGMHGTVYANNAANECDLLLTFGARFDDRVTGPVETFARDAKIVHVDIDLSEINKNKFADIGVVGNIKDVLAELNKEPIHQGYADWHNQIAEWKEDYPLTYKNNDNAIQPQYVMEKICELTNGEAIIVPGVGQHQMFASQYYTFSYPRQLLTSGGLGTMGFGTPTAMGAKLACPEKTVINIDGDGSFQMNIQELGTIHMEHIGMKMVVLNNQHLGMVAQWEDRFYGSVRGNTELGNDKVDRPYPNFVGIAAGYEIPGREVYKKEDVVDAIREMLETDGPFILDVHTGYQEHVLPMIPPGKCYKDIITE